MKQYSKTWNHRLVGIVKIFGSTGKKSLKESKVSFFSREAVTEAISKLLSDGFASKKKPLFLQLQIIRTGTKRSKGRAFVVQCYALESRQDESLTHQGYLRTIKVINVLLSIYNQLICLTENEGKNKDLCDL